MPMPVSAPCRPEGIGVVEAMEATQLGRRFPQFAAVDDAYP